MWTIASATPSLLFHRARTRRALLPMPASTTTLLNRLPARAKFRHVQVLLRLAESGGVLNRAAC